MPMVLPNSVFYMVPRTATTWARQAIRNAGIKYWETNPKHDTEVKQSGNEKDKRYVPRFCFTFTRDYDPWLKSRWVLGKWDDELSDLWDIDYAKFRAAVSDRDIDRYFKKYTSKCDYTGKTESIADDLVTALRMAREEFDEVALRDTPRINESPQDGGLIWSAYWDMRRDQLSNIPADLMGKLPPQLMERLDQKALHKLPPDILVGMLQRANRDAVDAGMGGLRHRR